MDEPRLSIDRLTVRYGRNSVVSNLNADLRTGVTALLGPNGAGKSTLLNALAQPSRASAGTISLSGTPFGRPRASRRWYQARLGFMPQRWSFFPSFSVQESVEYVGWLKRVPRSDVSAKVARALEYVGLSHARRELVARLSGGTRQRVGLAEALVNDPHVVLLDEPTVGLDPAQRSAFRAALAATKTDRVVLLSTHLTDDVAAIADRVLVLAGGVIRFDGSPADLASVSGESGDFSVRLERGYLSVLGESVAR